MIAAVVIVCMCSMAYTQRDRGYVERPRICREGIESYAELEMDSKVPTVAIGANHYTENVQVDTHIEGVPVLQGQCLHIAQLMLYQECQSCRASASI